MVLSVPEERRDGMLSARKRHQSVKQKGTPVQNGNGNIFMQFGRDNAVGEPITADVYRHPFPSNAQPVQRACLRGRLSPKVVECTIKEDTVTFSNSEMCVAFATGDDGRSAACCTHRRNLGAITLTWEQIVNFLPDFVPEWTAEDLKFGRII